MPVQLQGDSTAPGICTGRSRTMDHTACGPLLCCVSSLLLPSPSVFMSSQDWDRPVSWYQLCADSRCWRVPHRPVPEGGWPRSIQAARVTIHHPLVHHARGSMQSARGGASPRRGRFNGLPSVPACMATRCLDLHMSVRTCSITQRESVPLAVTPGSQGAWANHDPLLQTDSLNQLTTFDSPRCKLTRVERSGDIHRKLATTP